MCYGLQRRGGVFVDVASNILHQLTRFSMLRRAKVFLMENRASCLQAAHDCLMSCLPPATQHRRKADSFVHTRETQIETIRIPYGPLPKPTHDCGKHHPFRSTEALESQPLCGEAIEEFRPLCTQVRLVVFLFSEIAPLSPGERVQVSKVCPHVNGVIKSDFRPLVCFAIGLRFRVDSSFLSLT